MSELPAALAGVRVLDLADESGAYCGKLLADMGADVVLIEPPGGAPMRAIGPFFGGVPHSDRSLFFWHYNANKRSVTLDLDTPSDRARLVSLTRGADVVIDTGAPGQLATRGLGYATLASENPRLTLVSIAPFGQTGPHRHHRGSDLIAQAAGGMVFVNGAPDRPPLQGLGLQAYHAAGTYGAIGALVALLVRERTGHGQWIDVSMQECVAACVEHASSLLHEHGRIAQRQGSLHWTRNFRVGRCRDGEVLLSTLGDWTSLVEWVKADGKAADLTGAAWEDFGYRREQAPHLFDVLDEWARQYPVGRLVEGAQLRRLPFAAVVRPEALCDNPQLAARRFWVPVVHDELGATLHYPGAPAVFSRTPWRLRRRPPRLGEHNADLLDTVARPTRQAAAANTAATGDRGLQGIRVLDFTWAVAGPVATRILADHGADVIKVERPDAGDFGSRRDGLTGNLNRGKRSIVVDLCTAAGLEVARQLVARSDVVIDNFSARVMRNWGLDYAGLCRIKPDIIAVNMSGFGHTGPWRDYVSYGPTLQALAGFTALMRYPSGPALGWGFSFADSVAGFTGALAVLIALWHRRRSGEGQHVDLSQFESLVTLLGPCLLSLDSAGAAPGSSPVVNRTQERPAAPHGVYRCADREESGVMHERWCAIAVFDDDGWRGLCVVLGESGWARDARFATLAGRQAHGDELDVALATRMRHCSAEEVTAHLQAAGVAAAVVADAADLCLRDPQLAARGYWQRVVTPEGTSVIYDGVPARLSATPGRVTAAAPLLGEHTDAVLQDVLGLGSGAIEELHAAGAVR
jgi:crotonobetainyl-CoA:carnitine CoA-transferase CaiB-like acyl-CoA transferase